MQERDRDWRRKRRVLPGYRFSIDFEMNEIEVARDGFPSSSGMQSRRGRMLIVLGLSEVIPSRP